MPGHVRRHATLVGRQWREHLFLLLGASSNPHKWFPAVLRAVAEALGQVQVLRPLGRVVAAQGQLPQWGQLTLGLPLVELCRMLASVPCGTWGPG